MGEEERWASAGVTRGERGRWLMRETEQKDKVGDLEWEMGWTVAI